MKRKNKPAARAKRKQPFHRDISAELIAALHDYAGIFRERASMELHRAKAVEAIARNVEAGKPPEQPEEELSRQFARGYHLLEMRLNELRTRCSLLMQEHGENARRQRMIH